MSETDPPPVAMASEPTTSSYYKSNIPIAIIGAKDNKYPAGTDFRNLEDFGNLNSVQIAIQQAQDCAQILGMPCVFSSNGDGFLFHDQTAGITKDLPGFQNLAGLTDTAPRAINVKKRDYFINTAKSPAGCSKPCLINKPTKASKTSNPSTC